MGGTVARFARFLSLQKRLERARNMLVRETSCIKAQKVLARVGHRPEPYQVSLSPTRDEQWGYVIETIPASNLYGKLLAGKCHKTLKKCSQQMVLAPSTGMPQTLQTKPTCNISVQLVGLGINAKDCHPNFFYFLNPTKHHFIVHPTISSSRHLQIAAALQNGNTIAVC